MRKLDSANLTAGQRVAVKYFSVAMVLFGAQMLFGLLAAYQFIQPEFLYGILDFSVNRMVHLNAMIVARFSGLACQIESRQEYKASHQHVAGGKAAVL